MFFRELLQPTFRGRLRLFFLLIVIIPMIAVDSEDLRSISGTSA